MFSGEALDNCRCKLKFRIGVIQGDVLSLLALDLLSKNLIKSKIGVVGVRAVFQILAVNTWFTNDSFMVHSWLAHEGTILDNQHGDYSTNRTCRKILLNGNG